VGGSHDWRIQPPAGGGVWNNGGHAEEAGDIDR
jgi:hypothetical protein